MESFIRFQTSLRCSETARPLGVFHAAGEILERDSLVTATADWLAELLAWFNEHLAVPSLNEFGWRSIFWYFSSAAEFIARSWDLAAILKEEDVNVQMIWTASPGKIVYFDQNQIAAVPHRQAR